MSSRSQKQSAHSRQRETKGEAFGLIAIALSKEGQRLGLYIEGGNSPLLVETYRTVRSKAGELEELLVEHELDWVLERYRRPDLGGELRRQARAREVVVIDSRGAHQLHAGDSSSWVYVWNGRVYLLSGVTKLPVKLVGDALKKERRSGSYKKFFATVGSIATKNPRVLATILFALAPALRQMFGQPTMTLWLAGASSLGKNSTQGPCSAMTGPPSVELWDGTRNGMKDYFASSPDRAGCVDEVQLADSWEDVENIIMAVGNAGKRKRRVYSGAEASQALQSTPILSANKVPTEMHPRGHVPDQVWARLFVVKATGKYGMFDHLAGFDSPGDLAEALERAGVDNHGIVWRAWLRKLEKNRDFVRDAYERKFERLKHGINKAAGGGKLSPLNERILKRLTFVAFVGYLAKHLGLMKIDHATVKKALGMLFREHLDSVPKGAEERSDAIVMAVSEMLERNLALFPPVDSAASAQSIRGLLGYADVDNKKGPRYLVLPGLFRDIFEKKFGKEVYEVLAKRGYLHTQGSRHNLFEKRLTIAGKREKKFFIAISASILHFPGGA